MTDGNTALRPSAWTTTTDSASPLGPNPRRVFSRNTSPRLATGPAVRVIQLLVGGDHVDLALAKLQRLSVRHFPIQLFRLRAVERVCKEGTAALAFGRPGRPRQALQP